MMRCNNSKKDEKGKIKTLHIWCRRKRSRKLVINNLEFVSRNIISCAIENVGKGWGLKTDKRTRNHGIEFSFRDEISCKGAHIPDPLTLNVRVTHLTLLCACSVEFNYRTTDTVEELFHTRQDFAGWSHTGKLNKGARNRHLCALHVL